MTPPTGKRGPRGSGVHDTARRWVARHLIYLADRLAPEDAFRKTVISFEFVEHVGIETNLDGHGCPLWYSGMDDYNRAWERQRA